MSTHSAPPLRASIASHGALDDSFADHAFNDYDPPAASASASALGLDLSVKGDTRWPLDAPNRDSRDAHDSGDLPDSPSSLQLAQPDRERRRSAHSINTDCGGDSEDTPEEASSNSISPPSPRPSLLVRSTRERNLNRLSQEITSPVLTDSPVGSPSWSPQLLPRARSPRPSSVRSHRSIKSHHSLSHPHYAHTHSLSHCHSRPPSTVLSRPHTPYRSASRASSRPRSLAEEIADVGEEVPEPELSSSDEKEDVSWAAILGGGSDVLIRSSGTSFDRQRTAFPPPRSRTSSITSSHSVNAAQLRTPSFGTRSAFRSRQSSAQSSPPHTPDPSRPETAAPRHSYLEHLHAGPPASLPPTSPDFSPLSDRSPKRSNTISSLASFRSLRGFRTSRKAHVKGAPGLSNILVPSQSHLHLSDFPSPVPELPNEHDEESASFRSPQLNPRRVPVPPITPTRSSRRILPKMPKVFKKGTSPKITTTIETTEEHLPNGDIVERTTTTTRRRPSAASRISYSSPRSQVSHLSQLSHSSPSPSTPATPGSPTHFVENQPVHYVANVPSATPPPPVPSAVNVAPPRVRKEIKPIMIVDYANPPAGSLPTPGFTPSRATAPGPPVRSTPSTPPAVAAAPAPAASSAAKIPRTDAIDLATALALNPESRVHTPEPTPAPSVAPSPILAPAALPAETQTAPATVVSVDAAKGTVEVKTAPAPEPPRTASTAAVVESAPKAASAVPSQATPKAASVSASPVGSTLPAKATENVETKPAEKPAPQATTINIDPVKGNVEVITAAPATAATASPKTQAQSKATSSAPPKSSKTASPKPTETELPPRAKSPTPSLRSIDARVKRTSTGSEVIVSFSSQRGDASPVEKKVAESLESRLKAKRAPVEKPRRPDHIKHHSADSVRQSTPVSRPSHSSMHSKHHSVEVPRLSRSHSDDHGGRGSTSGRSSRRPSAESRASRTEFISPRKRRILNAMSHSVSSSDGEDSDGEVEIAFAETEASLDVKIKARVPAMISRDDSDEGGPEVIREDLATLSRSDLRARIAAAERLMKEHPRLPSEIDDSHMPYRPAPALPLAPKQWPRYVPAPADPRRYPAPAGLMPGLGFAGLARPIGPVPMMLARPQSWRRH